MADVISQHPVLKDLGITHFSTFDADEVYDNSDMIVWDVDREATWGFACNAEDLDRLIRVRSIECSWLDTNGMIARRTLQVRRHSTLRSLLLGTAEPDHPEIKSMKVLGVCHTGLSYASQALYLLGTAKSVLETVDLDNIDSPVAEYALKHRRWLLARDKPEMRIVFAKHFEYDDFDEQMYDYCHQKRRDQISKLATDLKGDRYEQAKDLLGSRLLPRHWCSWSTLSLCLLGGIMLREVLFAGASTSVFSGRMGCARTPCVVKMQSQGVRTATLRHEAAVLTALSGVAGVPRLLNCFRWRNKEVLVTAAQGFTLLHGHVETLAGKQSGPGQAFTEGLMDTLLRPGYSLSEVSAIAAQLVPRLEAIHQCGWLHRDIHPGNIVCAAGQWGFVDFQSACRVGSNSPADYNWQFASPAVLFHRGQQPFTAEDDIAALVNSLCAVSTARPSEVQAMVQRCRSVVLTSPVESADTREASEGLRRRD